MPHDLAQLTETLRPRLHRYAARMMGSAFDGEDVVQDALAKMAGEDLSAIVDVEAWMMRVTHTCALDALRRRRRQAARDARADAGTQGEFADSRVAVAAGLATFLRLPPGARSAVALTDVLGHSIAETAAILGMTDAAVKAAQHRGRARLRTLAREETPPPAMSPDERTRLDAYAERFNAHDWDSLRALLAEDVRLDLVNRVKLAGARDVSVYFTRYDGADDWHFDVGTAEGRPALLVRRPGAAAGRPDYVVLLDWRNGRIAGIKDFRYAPYVVDGLDVAEFAPRGDSLR